jgi:hypothetical protein
MVGRRNDIIERSTYTPGEGPTFGCQRETKAMQLGAKDHKIDLLALVGIALLTLLLSGAVWLPHGKASSPGSTDSAQRAHEPMPAVEPVTHPAIGRPKVATGPRGRSDLTDAPAGLPGSNALVLSRPVTSRHLETLHPRSHTDGKTQDLAVATAPQKTHRGGLYAVLLLLLANSRP